RAGGYGLARLPVNGGGRNAAEATGFVVVEGLDDLGLGVHDEGPVPRHRLADGAAAQDQDVERQGPAVVGLVGTDGHEIPRAENGQLALAQHRTALASDAAVARQR